MTEFNCQKCGACCRHLDRLEGIIDFPYGIANGVCEKLVGNKCSIYNDRPECCNYERMRKAFSDILSEDEFAELQNFSCAFLRSLDKEGSHEKIQMVH